MGRPSKIKGLPETMIDELNRRLINSGFTGYDGLTAWLKSEGFDISKSSVIRHGSSLESEFEEAMADARRTRALARAARESGDDNDNSLLAAATEIMQDNLLRVSLKLKNSENDNPDTEAKTLSLVARAFSQVGRLDIARQKWQAELATRMAADAAAAAISGAAAEGLTPEQAARVGDAVAKRIQIYLPDNGR
ncbi:phage protein Gp27 family protein [Azonexus sp.]|jgi:DNA-directed RNA polymerase subunit K/omega|uniref:phage protein Gp27 family protein n=1 Tax=Azonexus sp. TaxID=1872668 RepID=UPI00282D6893|nr:phage protein Gp27 family protein [Azonexus sp.]MDR1995118.1 DUF3486 family protein [Azonexus sp.]